MKGRFFIYDEATVSFNPYELSFLGSKRPIVSSAILSFFLSLGLLLSGITPSLQHWFYQRTKGKLQADLAYFSDAYNKIDYQLTQVNHRDQNLYRSILNLAPIDPNIWEAGIGGNVRQNGFTKDVGYQLAVKSQKINYQLTVQKSSFSQVKNAALRKMKEMRAIPSFKPIVGEINCGFNPDGRSSRSVARQARYKRGCSYKHQGIDIPARIGTQVFAAADGIVRSAGWVNTQWGYGIQVLVDHGNGYLTRYAHLSYAKSQVGMKVKRGDVIAYSGTTGMSSGPHLHYEVIKNNVPVDPTAYFLLNTEQ